MSSDNAKLVLAASKGNDAKVKRLLKAKVDVNYAAAWQDRNFTTALLQACSFNHVGKGQGRRVGDD